MEGSRPFHLWFENGKTKGLKGGGVKRKVQHAEGKKRGELLNTRDFT